MITEAGMDYAQFQSFIAALRANHPEAIAVIEAEAGLDEERLARALDVWWRTDDGGMPGSGSWEARGGWMAEAAAIAKAYQEDTDAKP